MCSTNLKIIAELKEFINVVSQTPDVLDNFRTGPKDFTRKRKLPFESLILLITRLCKKTLSFELENFFQELKTPRAYSVSAFTQQRAKLQPGFFYFWNMVLCKSFYFYGRTRIKRWKGYRLIAADGSSVNLINTPALMSHFGGQSNQKGPFTLAKTFFYYDVLNELILLGDIKPYRYGEQNMAYDAIDYSDRDMVLIYDRNFSSYKMMFLLHFQESERKFVIRAKETNRIIRSFIESNRRSEIIYLEPTASALEGLKKSGHIITKSTFIKIRLVRVDLEKSTEVLMTNLWEEEGHQTKEFKGLYFMRWGIETNISFQKNILQMESFSGLTVNATVQDFYATLFTANLHAILIKDAQKTLERHSENYKYPMKINNNKAFGRLKSNIVALFVHNDPGEILKYLHDNFIKDKIPIRKGRSFERVRKNIQSKTKHKTFTNYKPAY